MAPANEASCRSRPARQFHFEFAPDRLSDRVITVPERKISYARENALKELLDDESPVVQKALEAEFARLDDIGKLLLQKFRKSSNRLLASHAQRLLDKIEGPDPLGVWYDFIHSLRYELETGFILLSRTLHPNLDPMEVYSLLDNMGKRARELMVRPSLAWERCKVLNRVMYHEFGFRGEHDDREDPESNFLHLALRRRKGSPQMLSIIYLLLARRCQIELEPVFYPGRSLLGSFEPDEMNFYLDPFDGGNLLSAEKIIDEATAHKTINEAGFLTPVPTGEILCQCCRTLSHQYSMRNDPAKARIYARSVQEFEITYRRHAES